MLSYLKKLEKSLGGKRISVITISVILAIAYVLLVQTCIEYVVMPVIGAFVPGGDWRQWIWKVGNIRLEIGALLAGLLEAALIVWSVMGYAALHATESGEEHHSER